MPYTNGKYRTTGNILNEWITSEGFSSEDSVEEFESWLNKRIIEELEDELKEIMLNQK